jgi:hypothetical protein
MAGGGREAGPPSHYDDTGDSDQHVVNKQVSLSGRWWSRPWRKWRGGAPAAAASSLESERERGSVCVREKEKT